MFEEVIAYFLYCPTSMVFVSGRFPLPVNWVTIKRFVSLICDDDKFFNFVIWNDINYDSLAHPNKVELLVVEVAGILVG